MYEIELENDVFYKLVNLQANLQKQHHEEMSLNDVLKYLLALTKENHGI